VTKCFDCGYDGFERIYFQHKEKVYCDECYDKHVVSVSTEVLLCSVTCPFCGLEHEFDGKLDIEKCSCGAKVLYAVDGVLKFVRWD